MPADKGNVTVVMDTTDYEDKVSSLLQTTTYKELKRDPTVQTGKRLKVLLKKQTGLDNIQRQVLAPTHTRAPYLYGLPKIHKPDVPLRPIVSSVDSPRHRMAKYITKIITPVSGKNSNSLKAVPNSHSSSEM